MRFKRERDFVITMVQIFESDTNTKKICPHRTSAHCQMKPAPVQWLGSNGAQSSPT